MTGSIHGDLPSADVIVVGAGPNGLSAATACARAGLKPLVVEQAETVGGGVRSAALTLPGFLHDVCSAIHPLAVASPFFRQLNLGAFGLDWVHPECPLAHPLDDGTAVMLERSVADTAAALGHDAHGEGMNPVEVKNVSLSYDTPAGRIEAVRGASFSAASGEFLCLVGPSGCGKTTLLNMIAGFLAPSEGEVLVGGAAVSGQGFDRGIVFQDFAQLFPWRTALENVAFGLEMKDVPKAERNRIALEQLRLVKLEKFAHSYPHHLSGGMQQRVAIARALAYNPGVLLMDEPFAALDAMTRDEMQRLLAEVWRETKKTIVYVTHNVAEAVYLADRVVVMSAHPGRVRGVVAIGLPRPRDALSVEFLEHQKQLLGYLTKEEKA
jgi:NitT/TauT family transport system ATP-binding protein